MSPEPAGPGLRLFGHPLHVQLVDFPIAYLALALPCDLIGLWRAEPFWRQLAVGALGLGLVSALPAMVAGFADFVALPAGHPAESTAKRHLLAILTAAAFFAASLLLHLRLPGAEPGRLWLCAACSAAGFAVLSLGAWLGGELTLRFGVGRRP